MSAVGVWNLIGRKVMRTIEYILRVHNMVGVALLCLLVLSCEKSDDIIEGKDVSTYPVVVNVGVSDNAGTKVSVTEGNSLIWNKSDKLSFIAVSPYGSDWASVPLDLLSLSDDGATAKFEGSVSMSENAVQYNCSFVYPYVEGAVTVQPDIDESMTCTGSVMSVTFAYDSQTGAHKPFLYTGNIVYSSGVMSASLGHVGGMLRIKLPDASTIKKITVVGNGHEPLTPYVYRLKSTVTEERQNYISMTFSNKGSSMAEGAATSFDVELSASSLEQINGEYYCYIAMPPVKFAKGFSLIFSDGNQNMYRSFNYTTEGGCDFSIAADGSSFIQGAYVSEVNFAALHGAIVDIDASDFKGYSINASLAAEHVFENNTLTGTRVKLVGAAMQGFPASVVTEWGVELCNGSGEVVRSISYENLSGGTGYTKPGDINSASSAVMTNQNDWPYLPKGAYTVKPYVKTIYGDAKQYGSSSRFDVPALDASKLTPTVSAVTSYTYYKDGDRTNANREGTGSSIYNITAGVNISDAILANPKYAVNATVVDKSTNGTLSVSRELGAASQVLLDQHNVTEWKAYTLASYIEFDGVKTSEATTTVHVTGLPFKADPPTAADGWNLGDFATIQSGGLRLGGAAGDWQTKKSTATSPVFHIPENNVKFKLSISITKVTTAWSSQTLTIATHNGSSTSSTVISTKQQTCSNLGVSGTGSFTISYNRFYLENSATVIGRHFTIHTFNLEYEF